MIISFDFWGTIAISNPEFKKQQALKLGLEPEEWLKRTNAIKDVANTKCLELGVNASLPHVGSFYPLQGTQYETRKGRFINISKTLFKKNPPIVQNKVLEAMQELIELRDSYPELGIKIGIVSNTLSMPGKILASFLYSDLNLELDFFNFSNELEIAKPNPSMFKTKFGKVDFHVGNEPQYDDVSVINYIDHKEEIYDSIYKELFPSEFKKSTEPIPTSRVEEFKYSEQTFSSQEDIQFNPRDYSKLKYGSGLIAKQFGYELAEGLYKSLEFERFLKSVGKREIVIASAPFKYIPVAATALKDQVSKRLNILRSLDNGSPIVDLKVFRGHSYNLDYGALSKEKRAAALSSDSFYIDAEFISGKALILVDDVTITGAHEDRMQELLTRVNFDGPILYLYYAEYNGKGDPSIENYLNHASLDVGLLTIESIIKNEEFIFNTRVTKYILSSDLSNFRIFITGQNKDFIHTLYSCAVGNEYLEIKEFQENLNYLKTHL